MNATGAQNSEPVTDRNLSSLLYTSKAMKQVLATIKVRLTFLENCLFLELAHPPNNQSSTTIFVGWIIKG